MTLFVKDFGEILNSRPAGREAALSFLAYGERNVDSQTLQIDFEGVLVMTPSWLSEFVQTLQEKGVENIEFVESQNPTVISSIEIIQPEIA